MIMNRIKPKQLATPATGIMVGTLGRTSLEMVAAMIIRYHHIKGFEDWSPMPTMDFWDTLTADPITQKWGACPVWQPDLDGMLALGYVTGWERGNSQAVGEVTPKFIEAMSKSMDKISFDRMSL